MNTAIVRELLANPKALSVGLYGEQIVAAALREQGYQVEHFRRGTKRGDLVATDPETGEVITIEVKTSRRGASGFYQWTLFKRDKYGATNHRYSDIVVLLAALKTGRVVPFVIPVNAIRNLHSIKFRTHPQDYAGRYARYRQKIHNLDLGECLS